MTPLKYILYRGKTLFPVLVNIFAEDGTVSISHGGVEMGQGINTKVAQVAALTLGVPMEMVKVKPCSTLTSANTRPSGGSTTSEFTCQVSFLNTVVLYKLFYIIKHFSLIILHGCSSWWLLFHTYLPMAPIP